MRHRPTSPLSPSARDLLSAYIDGEVTAEERRKVEHRLQTEPAYQEAYRQLLRLQAGLSSLSGIPRTADIMANQIVADSVMAELDRSPLTGFISPRLTRRCARVAAGLMLCLSGAAIWQLNQSPQLVISLEEPPVEIPAPLPKTTLAPELVSIRKARAYLLSPDDLTNDAYSILLTDG